MSALADLKVPLVESGGTNKYGNNLLGRSGRVVTTRVTMALPLFLGHYGIMAHRVRRAWLLTWDSGGSVVGVRYWCGNDGSTGRGRLLAVPPEGVPICGTCEGRAVGAGWPSIAFLQQRYALLYAARTDAAPPAASEAAS